MKNLSLHSVSERCKEDGFLLTIDRVDIYKIENLYDMAAIDLGQAQCLLKHTSRKDKGWSTIFKLHYDVLHTLAEAFLLLEKKKARDHQCLFACICIHYSSLAFDWDFFEKVRTKRNGIAYYGTPLVYEDWKAIDVQIVTYIKILQNIIQEKLRQIAK